MRLKRTFDFLAALLGLVILSPIFFLIAILIKMEDRGTVFFRQERVGRKGHPFKMWKFRTMVMNAERLGLAITVGEDARITNCGRWLRKYKIDEFPQLINVIMGEMALVGPRPEVDRYVAYYTVEQRQVLELRPGITDPASLRYANESHLLAKSENPEECYIQQILPDKININLEYARRSTFWSDIAYILKTIGLLGPRSNNA